MPKINRKHLTVLFAIALFVSATNQVQAQDWLKAGGNLYVLPAVKVGIGTATPQRNFEVLYTNDSYMRVTSIGGNELDSHSAGVELKRSLFNGSTTTWSVNNESNFKIRKDGVQLFSLGSAIAWLGQNNDNPIEFAIYGKSILKSPYGSISNGALRLQSKAGNTLHVLRLDGNQLESSSDLYLNNDSDKNILLVNGGGKVKIGTTDDESRLNIASESDMQLKLLNTGAGGSTWKIGASNNSWMSGGGKFIISKSTTADTALVINSNNSVGIGTTTPNSDYRLSVNGKVRAKEIVVEAGWTDFVFEEDYALMPLEEVEAYIRANKHLPDVPSAKTIEADGVSVGEMEATLLQKVEELTLYLIALKKENAALAERIRQLEN